MSVAVDLAVAVLLCTAGRDGAEPRPDFEGRQAIGWQWFALQTMRGSSQTPRFTVSGTLSADLPCKSPAGQWMTWHLQNEGHAVNAKRIRRLMRLMRLMPIRCPAGHCEAMSREGTKKPNTRTQYTSCDFAERSVESRHCPRLRAGSGLGKPFPHRCTMTKDALEEWLECR